MCILFIQEHGQAKGVAIIEVGVRSIFRFLVYELASICIGLCNGCESGHSCPCPYSLTLTDFYMFLFPPCLQCVSRHHSNRNLSGCVSSMCVCVCARMFVRDKATRRTAPNQNIFQSCSFGQHFLTRRNQCSNYLEI